MPKIVTDAQHGIELALFLKEVFPAVPNNTIRDFVTAAQRAARLAKNWSEKCCNVPLSEARQRAGDRKIWLLNKQLEDTIC